MMKESTSVNETKNFNEHKRLVENLKSNRAKVGGRGVGEERNSRRNLRLICFGGVKIQGLIGYLAFGISPTLQSEYF